MILFGRRRHSRRSSLQQPWDSGCSGISSDKSCIIILTCVTHIDDILLGIVDTPFFLAAALFFNFLIFASIQTFKTLIM
jgi:hypothetical protein